MDKQQAKVIEAKIRSYIGILRTGLTYEEVHKLNKFLKSSQGLDEFGQEAPGLIKVCTLVEQLLLEGGENEKKRTGEV